jgi:hypothetical protein
VKARRRWPAGLAAALALVAGAASAEPGSGRVPPVRPLRVVDATGKLVGRVVDLGTSVATVRVRAAGRDLLLRATADEIGSGFFLGLLFETADCTGAGWVLEPPPEIAAVFLFDLVAEGPGRVLFAGAGPLDAKVIGSQIDSMAVPPVCVPVPPAPATAVRPAVQVLDPADWQPPFRLR